MNRRSSTGAGYFLREIFTVVLAVWVIAAGMSPAVFAETAGTTAAAAQDDAAAADDAQGASDTQAAEDDGTGMQLAAESAVLINAKTGQILYEKEKDKQQFPASTTKIMTALLTLENKQLDDVVTVSHDAEYTEGSRVYLFEGEHLTVEQLLYAMMLESANDAAIALAEAVGGTVEDFADMMNKRAEEIGAQNTHFVTPNGLPDDEHLTSAYDLALIAQEAMKNETFRTIVSTTQYDIPATDKQPETRHLYNSNKLLAGTTKVTVNGVSRACKYDGILGIKTGYTKAAQSCLVAGAERDGMEIIGVILKSSPDSQYSDMIQLLDYGFENFTQRKLFSAGDTVGQINVDSGVSASVDLTVGEDIYVSVPAAGSEGECTYEFDEETLTAPVGQGDAAGNVTVYLDGTAVGTYAVYTADSVGVSVSHHFLDSLGSIHVPVWTMAVIFIILLIAAYMAFVFRVRLANKRAREARMLRRDERRRQSEAREAAIAATIENDKFLSELYKHKKTNAAQQGAQRAPGEKNFSVGLYKK